MKDNFVDVMHLTNILGETSEIYTKECQFPIMH